MNKNSAIMFNNRIRIPFIICLGLCVSFLQAQKLEKQAGPIIADYGAVWPVDQPAFATDPDKIYKVIFDIHSSPEDPSTLNSSLNTLARFLNMHVQAGVPIENLRVACVIHGKASKDAMNNTTYKEKYDVDNPNAPLIEALAEAGAEIYICGQSVYSRGLDRERLVAPIQVALSAMTVILSYEEEGYHLIKF